MIKLIKINESHYKCNEGYYLLESNGWAFIPLEKKFSTQELTNILLKLKELNGEQLETTQNMVH